MSLLDDAKLALRVSGTVFDAEIEMLVDAARADLRRIGVRERLLEEGYENSLVRTAVCCYCKANFGYDVKERAQFEESYRRIAVDLANSSANVAADYDESQFPKPKEPEAPEGGADDEVL